MISKWQELIRERGDNVYELIEVRKGAWERLELQPATPCRACYSLSKNFTAAAVGMLVDEGKLSLDAPVLSFFPEVRVRFDAERGTDARSKAEAEQFRERLRRVTLRHLLSQTMGIGEGVLFEGDRYRCGTDDWVSYALSRPLVHEPGTVMVYSNSTVYLASCIVEAVSGETTFDFLRRRLFQPMGFEGAVWESCPMGHTMGATGLYLRTADLAKFGVMVLQGGVYEGRRYLSAEFLREATKPSLIGGNYGLSFWLLPEFAAFEGSGAHSQLLLFLPAEEMVIAAHAYGDVPYHDFLKACQK